MVETLSRNWGWIALRGVVAILFGALTLFYPGITLAVLVLWFGAYALADGIFLVVSAIAHRHGQPRWVELLAGGLLGIVVGVTTFIIPQLSAVTLLTIVAIWAIFTGITEVRAAIRLRKEMVGEWRFVVAGLLALALGLTLVIRPSAGALTVALSVSVYAVVSGFLLIAFAFRLRQWGRMHPGITPHPA